MSLSLRWRGAGRTEPGTVLPFLCVPLTAFVLQLMAGDILSRNGIGSVDDDDVVDRPYWLVALGLAHPTIIGHLLFASMVMIP